MHVNQMTGLNLNVFICCTDAPVLDMTTLVCLLLLTQKSFELIVNSSNVASAN